MSKHIIRKDIEFCAGHRVHNQTLNGVYSENNACSCRHIHGHNYTLTVGLTADSLTNGMVTDFRHLTWLKTWIDVFLDHQFILDRNDPMYGKLVGDVRLEAITMPGQDMIAGWIIDRDYYKNNPKHEQEVLEGFFIVNFVPTSENLSEWLAKLIQDKMSALGVSVESVELWESPKSRSVFCL